MDYMLKTLSVIGHIIGGGGGTYMTIDVQKILRFDDDFIMNSNKL